MRATTNIHIAFRNVGDSQDGGEFFEGTVSESILWLAQKLAKTSMATRFVVGMGRNKADAALGIDVKQAGKQIISPDMQSMLDSVFSGAAADDDMQVTRLEGDDYVA